MATTSAIYLRSFLQGEDGAIFGKGELARKVQNLVRTSRSTMRTLRGPCRYELGQSSLTAPFGVFHATLMENTTNLLLARGGTELWKHIGGSWVSIYSGLSKETRPLYPEMWCVINGRVIWSNGINRALQIDAYGRVYELGFGKKPSPPQVMGPQSETSGSFYPNVKTSWPGDIGTAMDVLYGEAGSLARSEYQYAVQFVHANGDLSALSPLSNPAVINEIHANPYFAGATPLQASYAELSDLRRQFWVTAGSPKSNGDVKAVRLYRTRDSVRYGNSLFFLAEIPGIGKLGHPDKLSDAYLTFPAQDFEVIPRIHAMCNHAGSLVFANDATVYTSLPGLAGSVPAGSGQDASSRGSAVTAVASYMGRKLAFTLDSIVDLTEGRTVLFEGGGAAGPRCVCPIPGVGLLALGTNGAYLIRPDGSVDPNCGLPELDTLRWDISHSALRRAVSTYIPQTREAVFWLPKAGSNQVFDYGLSFDGTYWRRFDIEMNVQDVCVTDDPRQLVLMAASDTPGGGSTSDIFVWDRENRAYTPPARNAVFETGWIQYSEEGGPFSVRDILIEIVDAGFNNASILLFKNGSWASPMETAFTTALINQDRGSGIFNDRVGTGICGTAKLREPRAAWRQVSCAKYLDGVNSFAFRITIPYPYPAELGRFIILAEPTFASPNANQQLARVWDSPLTP